VAFSAGGEGANSVRDNDGDFNCALTALARTRAGQVSSYAGPPGAMGAKAKSGYSRYADIHRRHECAGWEKTMFLLARYTVAAAVFLSASAASAVEDATLSADRMLPACAAFIADRAPREIDGVFQAGRCIGLMQGLGYASRLLGVCPPDEVTEALRARVAVTYVEAHPERMKEDFRVLAVEAMQNTWPCK
jgi:hypothetical protein